MKLIYLCPYTFPSSTVSPIRARYTARAFTELLGNNFFFYIRGAIPSDLKGTNAVSIKTPKRLRSLYYFLWFPVALYKHKWNSRDVVFFSNDPYLLVTCIFWKKILGLKFCVCSDWHQLFEDWKDSFIAKNSDYLVSTSNRLKDFLISKCNASPEKIVVAYGGVDLEPFQDRKEISKKEFRKKLQLPSEPYFIGYVGGLRSVGLEKGIDTMIKALPHLDEQIHMLFVGGKRQHIQEYEKLAGQLKVNERCFFLEKVPFTEVIDYELASDVLVIPYPDTHHFRDYGFPMKVWEYMATGRPIVYSNLAIMGEILKERAISFVPGDPKSLASAITSIYTDESGMKEIATKNIHDVQAYTWEKRVVTVVSFINSGHSDDTRSVTSVKNTEEVSRLFRAAVDTYKNAMKYAKKEDGKVKRMFYGLKHFGLAYVFFTVVRYRIPFLLKHVKVDLFFGRSMVLPFSDIGSHVLSIYGMIPHRSERKLSLWMMKYLRETEVFYDIGAHLGYYTALSEKIVTKGEVHAFEANAKLCSYLGRNFFDSGRVYISCGAIADKTGVVDFYDMTDIRDSSTSSRFNIDGTATSHEVRASTLDTYVQSGKKGPTVIKIDIEGGEYDAITGAKELIQKYRPLIVMEVWGGTLGATYSDKAVKLLQKLGYKAYALESDGSISSEPVNDPVHLVSGRSNESRDNFIFRPIS